ncbi:uncharacterized protein C5L36_0E05250 [Pichia kudriavzevii]|uniref:Protein PET117, mitochondrial n=1 Tax=Pichia kudriavzevii TaxID=4909 RepID=A0A2U9RC38_PICKU|nr:uncharacterized protein C5L36_0E05250 [Pichia kudriavzevii]AWU78468.1 hypothetical protein C5L36_0E05250 [Pichia kudriavzevii]
MSRASKITLALSTVFSIATIGAVYYMAEYEKDQLQTGPIRDKERLEKRSFNQKQRANLEEYEEQKKLFTEMQKEQPLSGEVVEGIDRSK